MNAEEAALQAGSCQTSATLNVGIALRLFELHSLMDPNHRNTGSSRVSYILCFHDDGKAQGCALNSKTFSMTRTRTTRLPFVLYGLSASNNRGTTRPGIPELPSGPSQQEIAGTSQTARQILPTLCASETSRRVRMETGWWKSTARRMARC
jgi:hypothetical protein